MKTLFIYALFLNCIYSCTKTIQSTINIPLKSEISTIDPQLSYDFVSNLITYQIYDRLYAYDYLQRPFVLIPVLAESLPNVLNNGKTYQFKIKDNIYYEEKKYFQGLRKMKAEDFIISLKRLAFQATKSKGWFMLKDKIVGLDQFNKKATQISQIIDENVAGLKVIDDLTFQVEFINVMPLKQVLNIFSIIFTVPIPKETILATNNDLSQETIGTGAYKLVHYQAQQEVDLEMNPNYNHLRYPTKGDRYAYDHSLLKDNDKKLPFIPKIHFSVEKQEDLLWKKFMEKKIDIMELPHDYFNKVVDYNGNIKENIKNENINLAAASSLIYFWIDFNFSDPIVGKNKKIRQAIAHAIDVDEYIQKFTNNIDQKANSIFAPGVFGYEPTHELPYKYDLELAKKFLKEAGYPDGKNLPTLNFNTRRDSEKNILFGKFIQEKLKLIGINVQITVNNFSEFLEKSKNRQMQFWHGGWMMDFPEPENILELLYSKNIQYGPNKSGYQNKDFDKLFEELILEQSDNKRFEILQKIERIVLNDLPWIMLNYTKNYYLYHSHVKNLRYSEQVIDYIKYLRLE